MKMSWTNWTTCIALNVDLTWDYIYPIYKFTHIKWVEKFHTFKMCSTERLFFWVHVSDAQTFSCDGPPKWYEFGHGPPSQNI